MVKNRKLINILTYLTLLIIVVTLRNYLKTLYALIVLLVFSFFIPKKTSLFCLILIFIFWFSEQKFGSKLNKVTENNSKVVCEAEVKEVYYPPKSMPNFNEKDWDVARKMIYNKIKESNKKEDGSTSVLKGYNNVVMSTDKMQIK